MVGEEQGIKFVLPGTAHKSLYAIHHYRHVEIPPALDLAAKLNLIKSLVADQTLYILHIFGPDVH